MDSVLETPAKRRKVEGGYAKRDSAYDSGDDSGDNLFDGYDTVETLLLPEVIRGCRPSKSPTPLSPLRHVTQPTQILDRAVQTPDSGHKPSVVQVVASSPLLRPAASSPPMKVKHPGGTLANRMAPPGTAFRPPIASQSKAPIVDLSSDDEDIRVHRVVSSDEESQLHRKADIKPSKFVQTSNDSKSVSLNLFKEITSQSFYKPLAQTKTAQGSGSSISGSLFEPQRHQATSGSDAGMKRSADVMANAYGTSSRPIKLRQTAPAKAQPEEDITLDQIEDYQVRTKVARMQKIFPLKRLATCQAALLRKKGNYDDAMEYLSALDDQPAAVDLTLSDNEQSSRQPIRSTKPTAKQQVKAPGKSIQSKWTATQTISQKETEPPSSPPPRVATPKPRKRLVQGRRKPSSPPPAISSRSNPATLDNVELTDTESPSDSAIGHSTDESGLDVKVLDFFNTCTSEQLSDIANVTGTIASMILSHKPFKTLDAVRRVHNESKSSSKRTAKRPVGDKIVDTCLDMWRGYNAVDGLVRNCESLGRPVAEGIKKWGVDVYGAAHDGGLDLTSFDHKPDLEVSQRDSGIGTPTSATVSTDEDGDVAITVKRDQNAIFGQPPLMGNSVVLKDYQIVGVNWLSLLYENGLSCILADDMGLGKTCQVIAFLAHLFEKGKKGLHLIIVPGSTIENWLREFRTFCPKLVVWPYYGKFLLRPIRCALHAYRKLLADQKERINIQHRINQSLDSINVIVTTYTVAKTKDDCKFLRRLPLEVCVYDEGHLLKNRKSAAYEQLTRFKCSFRLLLTGTPLQNNLSELVSLLAFIMPQIFRDHSEDLDIIFSHKAKTSDDSHAALLSVQRINRAKSIMAPFVLRRKKHQVLKHLPQKIRRVEYCNLSRKQAEIYNGEKARGLRVIADRAAGKKVGNETANVMMALRKAAIHPLLFRRVYDDKTLKKMARDCLKEEAFQSSQFDLCLEDMSVMMDYELQRFCERYPSTMSKYRLKNEEWMDSGKVSKLAELLVKFKENGDRVLVFSQFVMVMEILEDVMETLGMRFFRLDGSTKIEERQDMIDQFYSDEAITVFLLSTKAGGAGINLACANKIVIFDSSFNPQDDIQAENRAHRVGQTREVEVIRLVSRGTIEEQIHALGQTKLALDDRVAGEGDAAVLATVDENQTKQAEKQGEKAVEEMMLQHLQDEQGKQVK
ncbi:MAG: hypothetical protein L6R40_001293 [Gallowayella cf. fulva]|nr:MAG: hypothetical protein L6R40_001293 [Xanthomendoza cf. fulva]